MSIRLFHLGCVLTLLIAFSRLAPYAAASPLGIRPTNDDFAYARALDGSAGSVRGSNAGATIEDWEPYHANVPGGASVWFTWTARTDARMIFNTAGSELDTVLAVYIWPERFSPLTEIASNDDADSETLTSRVIFDAEASQTYYIAVDGYEGDVGNIVLNWIPAGVVSTQPKEPRSASPLIRYQSLVNMLGKSKTDPEFVAFASTNACIYDPRSVGFLLFEFWKCLSRGMEIQPNSGGRIDSIRLYGQPAEGYAVYPGELPNGITWQDTRAPVEQKMGRPDKTSVTSGQLHATYIAQSCIITYQTTGASARMMDIVVALNPR